MATVTELLAAAKAQHQAGNSAEAERHYQAILQAEPANWTVWFFLGALYRRMARLGDAEKSLRQAAALQPNHLGIQKSLGVVLAEQGKLDEAASRLGRLAATQPGDAELGYNLGIVYGKLGRFDEAAACFQTVLRLHPADPDVHYNLGIVEDKRGNRRQAIEHYRQALRGRPEFAEAHNNLGSVLAEEGELDESIESCRRALALKGDYAPALSRLVFSLQQACRWDGLDELEQRIIKLIETDTAPADEDCISPFVLFGVAKAGPQHQLKAARAWIQQQLGGIAGTAVNLAVSNPPNAKKRLKVGYLSSDFHAHATDQLIAELFEKHDRSRFEVLGYSYGRDDGSPMRQRLIKGFDRFVDLKTTSFGEAARRMSDDGVDILIDLKGYTQGSRTEIAALRPAPVQVNYLGYPGTMGADFIDYILVDDFIVPPHQQMHFTECLVHLPGCYQVNDGQRTLASPTPSRSECGLPNNGFVFCCFNNNYKITPAIFDVWMELLREKPGSVLWLLEGSMAAANNLRREANARGVGPDRLVFAPRQPTALHLARHQLADLFLDTFPCNAHTTASDALWAGCPVLTMAGETLASRVAGSLLRTVGLPELVTTSIDDYRGLALRLARDGDLLTQFRSRLKAARNTSSLFDAKRFARVIEMAFETMWEIYLRGEEPRPFSVKAP